MKYVLLIVLIFVLCVPVMARERTIKSDDANYSNYLYGTTQDTVVWIIHYLHSSFGFGVCIDSVAGTGAATTVNFKWRPLQDRSDAAERAGSPFVPIVMLTGAGSGAWAGSKTITLTVADSSGYGALYFSYDPDSLIGLNEEGLNPPACEAIEMIATPSDTCFIRKMRLGAREF